MKTKGIPNLKIRSKAKYDKDKCKSCKYHFRSTMGYHVKIDGVLVGVGCDYACMTGKSCLKEVTDSKGNKSIIDIRGNDSKNCKLYEPGKINSIEKTKNWHHHCLIVPTPEDV